MAKKRKTENATEALESIRQRIDLRTEWGKKAWKTVQGYADRNDTSKISLLKGLVIKYPDRPLVDVLNVDPVDYQRNTKGRCVCGQGLSKELYRMRIRGISRKGGMESQIDGRIKDKVKVSRLKRSSVIEFNVGSTCYPHFPDLLSDFGYKDMKKIVKGAKKRKRNELEEVVKGMNPEVDSALKRYKIDPEQFRQVRELMKEARLLTDESVLFEADPGKKNSWANWFRQGIKEGSIKNKEIIDDYYEFENAAHLVSMKKLVNLEKYAYESRYFETNAVVGGIRDDLLYLDSLENNDPLIKRFGKPNLDKHYVRPKTKFKSRKKLKKATIREKLEQSHLTSLEGLGIKLHFPDIENTRLEANRELAQKYGVGRSWNYILKEIKPVFEKVKEELAGEYQKFGKVVKDHVLSRKEYLTCKWFFERSNMGRRTERENYLRMHSIREFREAAPTIVVVGRKLRYARGKYQKTGDEEFKDNIIKKDYMLIEYLKDNFEEITGIKEDADKVIDVLVNTGFIESKSARNFLKKNEDEIRDMYSNKLIAKKHLKKTNGECALKRNYDFIRFGIREVDEGIKEKLEEIAEFIENPFVEYSGPVSAKKMKSMKYITREGKMKMERLHANIKRVKDKIGHDSSDKKSFENNKEFLEKQGNVLYLEEGKYYDLIDENVYNKYNLKEDSDRPFSLWGKKDEYRVESYNVGKMQEAVKNIKQGIELKGEDLERIKELRYEDLKAAGIEKNVNCYNLRGKEFDRVFISRELKEKIDRVYEKLR